MGNKWQDPFLLGTQLTKEQRLVRDSAADACWHTALHYTKDCKQIGVSLAPKQLIQLKLLDMQTKTIIAPELTSLIKRKSCGKSLDVAHIARDMLGGNGISNDFPIMHHIVNVKVFNSYEGIHDLILGRSQTNITAF